MKTGRGQSPKRPPYAVSLHPLLRKPCPLLSQMTSNPPASTHPPLTPLHEEFPRAFSRPPHNYPPTCMVMASHSLPWQLLGLLGLCLRTLQPLVPRVLQKLKKATALPGSQNNRAIALSLHPDNLAMKVYCASKISWRGASQR